MSDTELTMCEDRLRHLRLDYERVCAERDALQKVLALAEESLGVTTPEGLQKVMEVVEAARNAKFFLELVEWSDAATEHEAGELIKAFESALAALDAQGTAHEH